MAASRRGSTRPSLRPARVGRRLVVHGAQVVGAAAALALASSLVLVRWDDEDAPRTALRRHVSQPAASVTLGHMQARLGAPATADPALAVVPPRPIVHVSRLTRGGPQADAPAVEPHAALLELDAQRDLERAVYAAPDARARLELVDALASDTSPGRMIPLLETLLDRPAGRTGDDVRALRVGALARLGRYRDDLRAERRLLDAARDPRGPRLERLAAIDALRCGGPLHDSSRPTLERVAREDPDLPVRQRARWALGQG